MKTETRRFLSRLCNIAIDTLDRDSAIIERYLELERKARLDREWRRAELLKAFWDPS